MSNADPRRYLLSDAASASIFDEQIVPALTGQMQHNARVAATESDSAAIARLSASGLEIRCAQGLRRRRTAVDAVRVLLVVVRPE